jgi:hypothetical protein
LSFPNEVEQPFDIIGGQRRLFGDNFRESQHA